MSHAALHHIRHHHQAAVGVVGDAQRLAGPVPDRPHVVGQDERVTRAQLLAADYLPEGGGGGDQWAQVSSSRWLAVTRQWSVVSGQ